MNQEKSIHLPGLNGLRAIAAISVLLGHITSKTFINTDFSLPPFSVGEHGVTLFFVISGFLITYLLLTEKYKTNSISVKKFYFRRILRIWPLYYLFILIVFVLSFFIKDIENIQTTNILWYLFLTANIATIVNATVRGIIHYWSIGVEEQFYLFWPLFVGLSIRRLLRFTIVVVVLFFTLKSCFWFFIGNKFILYKFMNITRFHCMLIGCIGAMFYFDNNKLFIFLSTHKITQYFSWIASICIFFNLVVLPAPIVAEVFSLLSLLLIMGQVCERSKVLSLEVKWLDFLGKISYSIYVLHPLLIIFFSFLYNRINLPFIVQTFVVYTVITVSTIIVAYLSYNYFERPFLKLKNKYTIIESQNSIPK